MNYKIRNHFFALSKKAFPSHKQKVEAIKRKVKFSDLVKVDLDKTTLRILKRCETNRYLARRFQGQVHQHYSVESFKMIFLWCEKNWSAELLDRLGQDGRYSSIHHVLKAIYYMDGCFDVLHMLMLLDPNSDCGRFDIPVNIAEHPKSHLTGERMSPHEILTSMRDFLEVASCLQYRDTVTLNKENVIDFPISCFVGNLSLKRPIYLAFLMGRPDTMRVLLSYGARIPSDDEDSCFCNQHLWITNSESLLKHPIIYLLHTWVGISKDWLEMERNATPSALRETLIHKRSQEYGSLPLLLVDIPYHSRLARQICSMHREYTPRENLYAEVISLQNICRSKIRTSVRDGGRGFHPRIFGTLGLPASLKDYVSLEKGPIF